MMDKIVELFKGRAKAIEDLHEVYKKLRAQKNNKREAISKIKRAIKIYKQKTKNEKIADIVFNQFLKELE